MRALICFGTRPEYIKVKSIIKNIDNTLVCFIGQHTHLLKDIDIKPDYHLTINEESNNRLNDIFISVMKNSYIFNEVDYVLVQGDTTTAVAIAMSAFNNKKKVIHLEAGLRSYDKENPYPEELNRQIISRIADIHLCPTEYNKQNLIKENVQGDIYVVGNTGLDNINKENCSYDNKVLITLHRRENLDIMDNWFREIEKIANKYTEIEFMIPLHPNPKIQQHRNIFNKVKVVEPISHDETIEYLKKCRFVISDSGGLQEECSYLNKKIIVCRKTTERPETINIHSYICAIPNKLENIVDDIMNDYEINESCPYGDGYSWKKIKLLPPFLKYLVVGWGNIGSVTYGLLKKKGFHVDILSSKTEINDCNLIIDDKVDFEIKNISQYNHKINYDIIILTTPCDLYKEKLNILKEKLTFTNIIIGFPGCLLDVYAKLLRIKSNLVGYERVPYITRIIDNNPTILGMKTMYNVVCYENSYKTDKDSLIFFLDSFSYILNKNKNIYYDDFKNINLNNSNPLLHSSRLFTLGDNSEDKFFYRDWNNEASEIYSLMDNELKTIKNKLNLHHKSIFEHYEVSNTKELTEKIKSIKSLENILINNKINDRYYTEDIKIKLFYIYFIAKSENIDVPNIKKVLEWGYDKMKININDNFFNFISDIRSADKFTIETDETKIIELIQSYNKSIKHQEYNFRFFIDLLNKNNVEYCLAWGSLLGIVRHNDFIPWDDDFDIFIPDKDNFMKKVFDDKYLIDTKVETKIIFDIETILEKKTYSIDNNLYEIHYNDNPKFNFFQLFINNKTLVDIITENSPFMSIPLNKNELYPIKKIKDYNVPNKYNEILYRSYGNNCLKLCQIYNHSNSSKIQVDTDIINELINKYELNKVLINYDEINSDNIKIESIVIEFINKYLSNQVYLFGESLNLLSINQEIKIFQFIYFDNLFLDEIKKDKIKVVENNDKVEGWIRILLPYNITIELFKYKLIENNIIECDIEFYKKNSYYKSLKFEEIKEINGINIIKQYKNDIIKYFNNFGINKNLIK